MYHERKTRLKRVGGMLNYTGSVVSFSRLLVRTRPILMLRSAEPSESPHGSRSRTRSRNAPKTLTKNIAGTKLAGQEDVDSDYLFGNRLQLPAYCG